MPASLKERKYNHKTPKFYKYLISRLPIFLLDQTIRGLNVSNSGPLYVQVQEQSQTRKEEDLFLHRDAMMLVIKLCIS